MYLFAEVPDVLLPGSPAIREKLAAELEEKGLSEEIKIVQTGCFGLCALGPDHDRLSRRNILQQGYC